eukprot:3517630-Rhodomonas_salina.1
MLRSKTQRLTDERNSLALKAAQLEVEIANLRANLQEAEARWNRPLAAANGRLSSLRTSMLKLIRDDEAIEDKNGSAVQIRTEEQGAARMQADPPIDKDRRKGRS